MLHSAISKQDADNIQSVLECVNRNGQSFADTIAKEVDISMSKIDFYLTEVISKIKPVIIRIDRNIAGQFFYFVTPTDELATYLSQGGFMQDYLASERQKEQSAYKEGLVLKDLEASIESSQRALKQARISNIIAAISVAIALGALVVSLFTKS